MVLTALLLLLLFPSHATFLTIFFKFVELPLPLSDRLRFVAIELNSVLDEPPRIRFGLIVLIDVNSDNNGAVDVVSMFVGAFVVLIDDTDACDIGVNSVGSCTAVAVVVVAAVETGAAFDGTFVCVGFFRLKLAIIFSKSSLDGGLYGEPGFDASSLDVALESVQLNVATPLQ